MISFCLVQTSLADEWPIVVWENPGVLCLEGDISLSAATHGINDLLA